jgi:hypothetical protein
MNANYYSPTPASGSQMSQHSQSQQQQQLQNQSSQGILYNQGGNNYPRDGTNPTNNSPVVYLGATNKSS